MEDLFSCQCSTTLFWQRTEYHCTVFGIPMKWEITQKDFSEDIGHASVVEMKKNGMERTVLCGNSRSPERKGGINTIHSTAESGNIELFAHNSLGKSAQYPRSSIEWVWWVSWTDAWADIPESGQIHFESVWSVIETSGSARSWFFDAKPHKDRGGREHLMAWSLTTIQDAGSWRTGPYNLWISWIHKTSLCWNVPQNRFGKLTASCRKKTLPRAHQDSVVRIYRTSFEVKTFCRLHKHGIAIQITSTSGDNTNVWVVISRGSNRYVDELRWKHARNWCRTADYSIEILMQFIWRHCSAVLSLLVVTCSCPCDSLKKRSVEYGFCYPVNRSFTMCHSLTL